MSTLSLSLYIPQIFQVVQYSTINHRENAAALRTFQLCNSELEFNREFVKIVNKILAMEKGLSCSENVFAFIATFVNYCREKESQDVDPANSLSTRLIEFLLKHLLKGTEADNTNVRFRVCQLISLVLESVDALDDDLYKHLKDKLTKRLIDVDSSIRVKAVEACSRIQSDTEMGMEVTKNLLRVTRSDPIADVRRAALLNIKVTKETILCILERARDVDANVRRDAFIKTAQDISDICVLSISYREKLLKYGLTDRDPQVKMACSKLLVSTWLPKLNNNLLKLLERIDVVGSDIAQEVLLTIFKLRPDITQTLTFNESFWKNLTIESAFLVRVFCEFNKERVLEFLPEVTTIALCIQEYNNLMSKAPESEYIKYEFIVNQLLLVSKFLDYGDEFGRRQMFNLLREILMLDHTSEAHTESAVDVIKKTSINEQDFTRTMIEILHDIQEKHEDEDNLSVSMFNLSIRVSGVDPDLTHERKDKKLLALIVNAKCLHITRCILERCKGNLCDNPSVYGLLNKFVIPNIKCREPSIRELSVHCLGLGCLLDQKLANENLELLIQCARHGHLELQKNALTTIFCILVLYNDDSRAVEKMELLKSLVFPDEDNHTI